MPRWKPRDPSIFPPTFGRVVETAHRTEQPSFLQSFRSPAEAKKFRNIFREWRFCLRTKGTPGDRCFEIEKNHRICTMIETHGGLFEVWVEIRPRILASLAALNPDLDIPL